MTTVLFSQAIERKSQLSIVHFLFHWKIAPQNFQQHTKSCPLLCCSYLCPTAVHSTWPKESWQNYSKAHKDTNGRSRQLALASALITSNFCNTTVIKPLLCASDRLHGAATLAFGTRGFRGWDSQRSVMNRHVWSAAGRILGEIERGRKMNIELTCWAGYGSILSSPVQMSSAVTLSLACEYKYLHCCHNQDL